MTSTGYHLLKKNSGYTLLELTITVAVLAMLTALTIPTAATYYKLARKLDCQATVTNFLRAQDLYYLDNKRFYQKQTGNFWEDQIGWTAGSRPDAPDKYVFPDLGVEFRPDKNRGYRIRVWDINTPTFFYQGISFELQTEEDFSEGQPDPELYTYWKYNWAATWDPGTKGLWEVFQANFWFDIPGAL